MDNKSIESASVLILTGIYGSGKTTVARSISSAGRKALSLDILIGYGVPGIVASADDIERRDLDLYRQLTSGDRVVLDGLPIYDNFHPNVDRPVKYTLGTRALFLEFLRQHPSTQVVVLTCNLYTWLTTRLPSKLPHIKDLSERGLWNKDHPEWVERQDHYLRFYGPQMQWMISNFSKNLSILSTE